MITYKNVPDSNNGVRMVRVFSEGRFVGTIESIAIMPGNEKHWQYFPDGHRRNGGDVLPTIAQVKKELESE